MSFKDFWRREDGTSLTEYVIMLGGIAVAGLVAVNGFSDTVTEEWEGISGSMVWSTPSVEAPAAGGAGDEVDTSGGNGGGNGNSDDDDDDNGGGNGNSDNGNGNGNGGNGNSGNDSEAEEVAENCGNNGKGNSKNVGNATCK